MNQGHTLYFGHSRSEVHGGFDLLTEALWRVQARDVERAPGGDAP